jgi:hypothetical protein
MGNCRKVAQGNDKVVTISDDQGSCDIVIDPPAGKFFWEIPLTVATTVAPSATSLTVGTVPPALTKLLIRKKFTIGIKNPGADYYIPARLTADFVHTTAAVGTTLIVEPTLEPILSGAIFVYPVPIEQVSSVTLPRSRQAVQGASTDADGFKPSAPGSATATSALTMDADDTGPGQANVNYFQSTGETCVLTIWNPSYRSTIKRKVRSGIGYFSDADENIANDAVPTFTATFNFDRKPKTTDLVAA